MNTAIDIQDLEARLMSGDLETQVNALKQAKGLVEAVSKAAVDGFRYTNNPFLYAEGLSAFGQTIVSYLEMFYAAYEKGVKRTNLAILLLFLGSRSGLVDVLGALNVEDPCHIFAASKLANAGIAEAVEPITKLLRAYTFGQAIDMDAGAKINTLTDALVKLGAQMPSDIEKRLRSLAASMWFIAPIPSQLANNESR